MGLLGSLFDKVKHLSDDFLDECKKLANTDLLEATIAASVWVSAANGEFKSEEKQKMLGYVERNEGLKCYKRNEVIASANKWMDDFAFDFGIAEEHAKEAIQKIRDEKQARILVKLCCSIGSSDGEFDKDERAVVTKICNLLMLRPSQFGL